MRTITVSSCNLNQWALDFVGNRDRILEAVRRAKKDGSALLITPELSICGYSCLDAFLEQDTILHSWEVCVLSDSCRSPSQKSKINNFPLQDQYSALAVNTQFIIGRII